MTCLVCFFTFWNLDPPLNRFFLWQNLKYLAFVEHGEIKIERLGFASPFVDFSNLFEGVFSIVSQQTRLYYNRYIQQDCKTGAAFYIELNLEKDKTESFKFSS